MAIVDRWRLLPFENGYLGNRNSKGGSDKLHTLFLFIMSTWESNLKMITVDEAPKLEALHTINWLKTRSELLLSKELAEEALSLINEFDDPLEAVSW